MNGLGSLLILATWVGSVVFGWLHHLWWLAVPPVLLTGFMVITPAVKLKRHGIGPLWNTTINFVIFGAAWLLHN
jgi:hypothetical protein